MLATNKTSRKLYYREYYRKNRDRQLQITNEKNRKQQIVKRRFPFSEYVRKKREEWKEQGKITLHFD